MLFIAKIFPPLKYLILEHLYEVHLVSKGLIRLLLFIIVINPLLQIVHFTDTGINLFNTFLFKNSLSLIQFYSQGII